ncbi:MAG: MadS family sensor histidine kinase [Mycobacteriaceae bacterium]
MAGLGARRRPDLEALTGVRSGKGTFYRQYRGAAERLERVLDALDTISRALVRTVEGPETLVLGVVEAAAQHLSAEWVLFALVDGTLPEAHPRQLVLGPDGTPKSAEDPGAPLPEEVLGHLQSMRAGHLVPHEGAEGLEHHTHVPIELGGGVVGAFVAWTPARRNIDATDSSVLRILANQTAVALQNSALFQRSQGLLVRAESSYAQSSRHARELALRNVELEATQRQLGAAHRREVLDSERHRISRELHDSVTQCVLSAGMQIEVCRSELGPSELASPELMQRLEMAKDLTRRAVEQLRSAIYALNHDADSGHSSLPEALEQLGTVHMPDDLQVLLRIEGQPCELSPDVEHALFRIAGEALFNTAVHANASMAVLRLSYRVGEVMLSVADDGTGDPAELRRVLRLAVAEDVDGHHRGLANMQARTREMGGSFQVRRARLGGIRVAVLLPLAELDEGREPDSA